MSPVPATRLVLLAVTFAGSVTFFGAHAHAQTTLRVSVASTGAEGDLTSGIQTLSISSDGRFVAFLSEATNLVAGDTNAAQDVFVRDRQTGTTTRVSVSGAGAEASSQSGHPSISSDGRFVAFDSFATNLVAGDTNDVIDVFVRDRQAGTTERVSIATGGAQASSGSSSASISSDGRFVAFESDAQDLVAGDTNGTWDVFVHDRQTGTTRRASVATGGAEGDSHSRGPSISPDGRFVGFTSAASSLVAGDTNGADDVFVRDLENGTTVRVSVATGAAQSSGPGGDPALSHDGRFVAFRSLSGDLVAGDTNGVWDVFVHDRQTGATERVSVDSIGAQADFDCGPPSISADGRFVAFDSDATNLVAGDTNSRADTFVHDRQTSATERVSVSALGAQQGTEDSRAAALSSDGRYAAFHSDAPNLVAGDTNGYRDVFVRDRSTPPPPVPFCFGDGSGTQCLCGNSTVSGNGCPNSVNQDGANLAASGSTSLAADTLVLSASGMPESFGLFFQGSTQVAGGAGSIFGDGLRCAGGTFIRLAVRPCVGGASQYPTATSDLSVSVRGSVAAPGPRTYQVWYRNPAVFCTQAVFNLTNGLAVTWTP
jgi:Tol biopolymer transport system component